MDRSFLSQPEVIAAARSFVCVRLATYESQVEGEFLKAFRASRSGELENTVFVILSSDGKQSLVRAARSARQVLGDAKRMAAGMSRIAAEFTSKATADALPTELPKVANVRLAVNVAACDGQPLVVLYGPDAERRKLETRLLPLAWGEAFRGRFVYVAATAANELASVEGTKPESGLLVVEPDRFGQKGKSVAHVSADATRAMLAQCLRDGLARHQTADKTFRNHVQTGHRLGVFWQTAIPVTDPMERRARERGRGAGPGPD